MDDFIHGEPSADADYDGVIDLGDTQALSYIRRFVDVQSTKVSRTRIVNLTLANGKTIQDIVDTCRASEVTNRNIRKCREKLSEALVQ